MPIASGWLPLTVTWTRFDIFSGTTTSSCDIAKQKKDNCMNKKTENGIRTNNGHLIIAVLHDVDIFDESKHDIEDVMSKCKERMSTEPDNLKGGMGDIA